MAVSHRNDLTSSNKSWNCLSCGAMVVRELRPRGGRKYERVPKVRNAAELADDAIRVGAFGAPPVINRDMALLQPGVSLPYRFGEAQFAKKLLEIVCLRKGNRKNGERDGGPSGGRLLEAPLKRPNVLTEIEKNWKAHEFYSEALEVRRDPGGELGLYFKKAWRRGKSLGTERIHHAIATRFSRHDGHSVAERLDRTSVYGRPVKFVGLASLMNHGCIGCAHFGQPSDWFAPWKAVRTGRAREQALVYYGPGQEYACPKCGATP